jgi:hypothetical protein
MEKKKRFVPVLILGTCKCDLIGKKLFNMRSHWIRAGPLSMSAILLRREF